MKKTIEDLPLADPAREEHALSLFNLDMSPEEFAARHGHEIALFSFDEYRYRTPGMTEWVQELGRIFFSPDLPTRLRRLRERYLTPEEMTHVEAYEKDPF